MSYDDPNRDPFDFDRPVSSRRPVEPEPPRRDGFFTDAHGFPHWGNRMAASVIVLLLLVALIGGLLSWLGGDDSSDSVSIGDVPAAAPFTSSATLATIEASEIPGCELPGGATVQVCLPATGREAWSGPGDGTTQYNVEWDQDGQNWFVLDLPGANQHPEGVRAVNANGDGLGPKWLYVNGTWRLWMQYMTGDIKTVDAVITYILEEPLSATSTSVSGTTSARPSATPQTEVPVDPCALAWANGEELPQGCFVLDEGQTSSVGG